MKKWRENTRKVMHFLFPGLLKPLDHYLLTHHPLVWRTRVHYFFFYFALLGNMAAWYWGHSMEFDLQDLPNISSISRVVVYLQVLGLLILSAWAFGQYQRPLDISLRRYLPLTFVLYVFCIFSLSFSTIVVYQSLMPRIAALVPDAGFEASYQLHAANDFWLSSDDPSHRAAFEKNKTQITEDLILFDALPPSAAPTLEFGVHKNLNGLTYEVVNEHRVRIDEDWFGNKIKQVKDAKDFRIKGPYYEYSNYWRLLLGISLFFGLLLALRVHFNAFFLRKEAALRQFFQPSKKQPLVQNTSISKMEGWLITRQPYIWSTKLHKLLKILLRMIPIVILIDVLTFLLTGDPLFLGIFFKEAPPPGEGFQWLKWETFGFALGAVLFSLIFGLLWSFQQHRRKELPPRFWDNIVLLLIYYVIACAFYLGVNSLILLTNFADTRDLEFTFFFMPYLGIIIAGIIYLSKFINRRRAMLWIPVLGFVIVSLLFLLYNTLMEDMSADGLDGGNEALFTLAYIPGCLLLLYGLCWVFYRQNLILPMLVMAATYLIGSSSIGAFAFLVSIGTLFNGGNEELFAIPFFLFVFPVFTIFLFIPMIKLLLRKKMMPAAE
ncbi:MAG: hypothetical protein AAGG75_07410 [Bacteroidota bacterium]